MADYENLLLLGSIAYIFLIAVGVAGNVVFVIGSITSKKLESAIHHFIVISAVADTFVLLLQIVKLYTLYGKVSMAQSTCLYILCVPMIGSLSSALLLLVQGVDRLLAAAFPHLFHELFKKRISVLVMLMFPLTYSGFVLVLAFREKSDQKIIRLCTVYDALNGVSDIFFFNSSLIINAFNCLIYCIAWYFIKRSVEGPAVKRLFVSLFLTVSLVVVGWGITCLVSVVLPFFTNDEGTQNVVKFYGSLFALVGCASNPYIYIARNKDYRDAVFNLFKRKSQNANPTIWASYVLQRRK